MRDTIIIGGGHNALVTAFYLARAGRRPLVLERREVVGGCAISEEFAPGYTSATLAHTMGPIRPSIVADMQLQKRVQFVEPDPTVLSLAPDGPALVLSSNVQRVSEGLRAFSPKDAAAYPEFCETLQRLGAFVGSLLDQPPPSIDGASSGSLWDLLKTGRRFRALGKRTAFTLLRWGPMAVADLVGESFENDRLQAAIATRGIFGTAMGPWSAGTGTVLLLSAAVDPVPGGSSITTAGGPGALTRAMADAAREAGVEIRTGAGVDRILVKGDVVSGVTLDDGTEILANAVVSGADPRRTFLQMIDPVNLDPTFAARIRNYRCAGTVAKLNVALGALPAFRGIDPGAPLGRVLVAPGIDYLERAFDATKYGEISQAPYLELTFPTAADKSMAPSGKHVMSVHVQYAPFKLRGGAATWDASRDALRDTVFRTLEDYAPGITSLVEHCQVVTPLDLERTYGLTGGHIFHGELALDQLFVVRPTLGWSRYETPLRNLFLCGSGTHPGNGLTGASGRNAARTILKQT